MKDNYIPFVNNDDFFAEELFKKNIGKIVTLYMSYPNYQETKSFKGIIEGVGKDFVIISDPSNGKWYILIIPYLNYAEFDEEVNK